VNDIDMIGTQNLCFDTLKSLLIEMDEFNRLIYIIV
jgi:hypothetical protein